MKNSSFPPAHVCFRKENLYRFEEIEMLAHKIVDLFNQEGRVDTEEMRTRALYRHNSKNNVEQLMSIYSIVAKKV